MCSCRFCSVNRSNLVSSVLFKNPVVSSCVHSLLRKSHFFDDFLISVKHIGAHVRHVTSVRFVRVDFDYYLGPLRDLNAKLQAQMEIIEGKVQWTPQFKVSRFNMTLPGAGTK